MTYKLQALWQNGDNLLINPPGDIATIKRPVRDQHAVKGAGLTFSNEFLPVSRPGYDHVGESDDLRPCVVGAV